MLSPTAQEYSDQRVDHSQHVKRKAVLMAIGDQYLCSLNARGRTTIERQHVVRHLVRHLEKKPKCPLAISIGWQSFPNKDAALAGGSVPQNPA
jgi:hypothetical protein